MRNFLLRSTAFVTIAVATGFGAAPAIAANYTHTEMGTFSPVSGTSSNFSNNITFNLFASGAGNTLKSVMVFEDLKATYKGNVTSTTPAAGTTASGTAHTTLGISGGPAPLNGTGVLTLTKGISGTGITSNSPHKYTTAGATNHKFTVTTPTALADFEKSGGGTKVLTISLQSGATGGNGFSFNGGQTATFTGHYTYVYTNDVPNNTPEPASMLMLGAGVPALGAVRGRRKRKASRRAS